jgi:hypothetical protein
MFLQTETVIPSSVEPPGLTEIRRKSTKCNLLVWMRVGNAENILDALKAIYII